MSKELDQHEAAAWSQRQHKRTQRKKTGTAARESHAGEDPVPPFSPREPAWMRRAATDKDFRVTWAIPAPGDDGPAEPGSGAQA